MLSVVDFLCSKSACEVFGAPFQIKALVILKILRCRGVDI